MIERTLLKIEAPNLCRSWNDPTIVANNVRRFILCIDETQDYFDVPVVDELTLVLSSRYSETAYEFVKGRSRDFFDPRIMIDGESCYVHLYTGLAQKINRFLRNHGRCYLSLEWEER